MCSAARSRSAATATGRSGYWCSSPAIRVAIRAASDAHFVVVGGAAMDGPRHIWWNFVSSRKERIEAAKADWKAGRFDIVPGDTTEFIPLPD